MELLALGTKAYTWVYDQELKVVLGVGVGLSNREKVLVTCQFSRVPQLFIHSICQQINSVHCVQDVL